MYMSRNMIDRFQKWNSVQVNNAAEIGIIIHEEEFRAGGGFVSKSPRIVNLTSMYGDLYFLHNEKLKEELQDIENLTEERIDEIIKWFLLDLVLLV
ncbi:hypothetical protein Tco_0116930 [Tanacetum coccineum]